MPLFQHLGWTNILSRLNRKDHVAYKGHVAIQIKAAEFGKAHFPINRKSLTGKTSEIVVQPFITIE